MVQDISYFGNFEVNELLISHQPLLPYPVHSTSPQLHNSDDLDDVDESDDLDFFMAMFNPGVVVFSGGSAANSLVDVFDTVRASKDCPLSYIIPISDNGGSSSELIRVFGGPGIGDVRSISFLFLRLLCSLVSSGEIVALTDINNRSSGPPHPTTPRIHRT